MEGKRSPKETGISDLTGKVVRIRHATEPEMVFIEEKMKKLKLDTRNLDYREFVVATEDGEIVGFGRLKQDCGLSEIGCVVVIDEKRKHGIAAEITRHLVDYAPVKRVYIFTDSADFFRGMGFKKAKKTKEYFHVFGPKGEREIQKGILLSYEKADT
ncbi:MAG: GNAT family N-acetyltransferase [Nitrospirota bacterium]